MSLKPSRTCCAVTSRLFLFFPARKSGCCTWKDFPCNRSFRFARRRGLPFAVCRSCLRCRWRRGRVPLSRSRLPLSIRKHTENGIIFFEKFLSRLRSFFCAVRGCAAAGTLTHDKGQTRTAQKKSPSEKIRRGNVVVYSADVKFLRGYRGTCDALRVLRQSIRATGQR